MKRSRKHTSESGSVIIVALMICAMGALGITAWVSVLDARNGQVNSIEAAIARRISAENGRAAAKEYFYRNVVTKSSGAAYTENLPGGWGSFTVAAWGTEAPMSSSVSSAYNQFGPVPYLSYTKNFTVTISDGVSDLTNQFQVRSRSPMLGGDLFTLHSPTLTPAATNTVSGPFNVLGRAVIWTGEPSVNVDDMDAEQYVNPDGAGSTLLLGDPVGGVVMPDNYPLAPATNNEFGGVAYNGSLNVVDGGVGNEANSMLAKMGTPTVVEGSVVLVLTNGVECDGAGRVDIDLDDPNLPNLVIRDAEDIYFAGQTTPAEDAAAAALPPVTIVSVRTTLLQRELLNVRMFDRNFRRLNFGLKKLVGTEPLYCFFYDADTNPTWRMLMTLENTPTVFQNVHEGIVTIQGGLQSDRSLALVNGLDAFPGSINFENETDPGTLEAVASRTAWIESYWQ